MPLIATQGTTLYFIDPTDQDTAIKLACPTGISGLGGAADQIEVTCLEAKGDKSYMSGLGNPGQISVPFNLNPSHASHQALFTLKDATLSAQWIICCSDCEDVPTVSAGGFTPPSTGTSFRFSAYVSDVNIDIASNEIIRGTITLQRSGSLSIKWGRGT